MKMKVIVSVVISVVYPNPNDHDKDKFMMLKVHDLLEVTIRKPAAYIVAVRAGHYIIPGAEPYDAYHDLHLPHNPPLYPTLKYVPPTRFSCEGRDYGYYADVEAGCQAYHLCQHKTVASFLCTNGTLFNEQFQVCDQFYNVRCGSPYIDL